MGKQPTSKSQTRRGKLIPDLPPQIPPTRVLDETYWLQFGSDPRPSTRQKMMYVTVDDVARVGPVSFNAVTMCDEVGVTDGLLNFHFGSRNELLAETLVWVYQRFVNEVAETVAQAKVDPETKLRAWITAVHQGFVKMGGWGVLVNYPIASREVAYLAENKHGKEFVDMAELNLARLQHLISDFKKGQVTDFSLEPGGIPKPFFVKNPGLTALTVSVALSTSAMAVWQGGRTEGQAKNEGSILDKLVIKTHVDRIIKSI